MKRKRCGLQKLALVIAMLFPAAAICQDSVRIGVWNIEKLSESASRGFPELRGSQSLDPRTNTQLDQMAEYIKDELDVDALMVTEIEADSPLSTARVPESTQLNRVVQQLGPNWRYFLGRTGGKLRLGLLFDTSRIRLKKLVNLHASAFHVTGRDVLDRDPFIAWVNVIDDSGQSKNDVLLVCVHLKSIQGRFRHNRMAAVAKLIGDMADKKTRAALQLPGKSEEREILVLGDCNDSSFKNPGFKFMFDYLAAAGFAHLQPSGSSYPDTRVNGSKIDHIFATSKVVSDTMVSGSFQVHTVPGTERRAYREKFSDHFPVTLDLRVRPDDDRTLDEALLVADEAERGALLAEMTDEIGALIEIEEVSADDEEDDSPPVIEFDVIDSDFERILAPRRDVAGDVISESGDLPPDAMPIIPPTAAEEISDQDAAMWTAIELIQENVAEILSKGDNLSTEDIKRVRQLVRAQSELLKALRQEK